MTARILRLPPANPVDVALTEDLFGERRLRINDKTYAIDPLPERPGLAAVSLTSEQADVHDVWITAEGLAGCSCMDYSMRSGPEHRMCKHLFAVFAMKILTPTQHLISIIEGLK